MKDKILSMYRQAKKEWKENCQDIIMTAMILQNLEGVLPDWEPFVWGTRYVDFKAPEGTTVPEFMKVIDGLAKKLNLEPDKTVNENSIKATFQVHLWKNKVFTKRKYYNNVHLEFSTKNSEPCEITYKRKMRKVPILTGYCKEIAEQKHLA